jgi:hypothetical protein
MRGPALHTGGAFAFVLFSTLACVVRRHRDNEVVMQCSIFPGFPTILPIGTAIA